MQMDIHINQLLIMEPVHIPLVEGERRGGIYHRTDNTMCLTMVMKEIGWMYKQEGYFPSATNAKMLLERMVKGSHSFLNQ